MHLPRRFAVITLAALFLSLLPAEAGKPVAVLRAESLDAVGSDLERLVRVGDPEFSRDQVLGAGLAALGISDHSWIEPTRPLGLVFPIQGLMLGVSALAGVLPVKDTDAALAALAAQFDNHEVGDDGAHSLTREGEAPVFVAIHDGHLVLGQNRKIVLDTVPNDVIGVTDLPPGRLALDVDMQSVAPMAQMGLLAARQMAPQQLAGAADADADPQLLMAYLDIYIDLLQDLINNTGHIQLGIEIADSDIITHLRILPATGSTLEGLAKAQRGGLPDLARYLHPAGDDLFWAAGQITSTPAFADALTGYISRFGEVLKTMGASIPDLPAKELIESSGQMAAENPDYWSACFSGGFAQRAGLDSEGGMRMVQIFGTADADTCRNMVTQWAALLGQIPKTDAGDSPMGFSITENALTYAGVEAARQEMTLNLELLTEGDPTAGAMLSQFFGDGTIVTYSGLLEDLFISASGTAAEQTFKDVIDRVSSKKKSKTQGVTAEMFAPLETGPGFFMTYDLGRLLSMLPDMPGLDALKFGADSRTVYGVRFEPAAVNLDFSLPLSLLESIAAAAEAPAPVEDTHEPADLEATQGGAN